MPYIFFLNCPLKEMLAILFQYLYFDGCFNKAPYQTFFRALIFLWLLLLFIIITTKSIQINYQLLLWTTITRDFKNIFNLNETTIINGTVYYIFNSLFGYTIIIIVIPTRKKIVKILVYTKLWLRFWTLTILFYNWKAQIGFLYIHSVLLLCVRVL